MSKVVSTEIVPPDSVRGIYEEALAELAVSERDQAKRVIAGRLAEIQHLEACLRKAKQDLQALLGKDISEISLL